MKKLLLALLIATTPAYAQIGEPPADLCPGDECCDLDPEPTWEADPPLELCLGNGMFMNPVAYNNCLAQWDADLANSAWTAHVDWVDTVALWELLLFNQEQQYDIDIAEAFGNLGERWSIYLAYIAQLCLDHQTYEAALDSIESSFEIEVISAGIDFRRCVSDNACLDELDWPAECTQYIPLNLPMVDYACLLVAPQCPGGGTPEAVCTQEQFDFWNGWFQGKAELYTGLYLEKRLNYMLSVGQYILDYNKGEIGCLELEALTTILFNNLLTWHTHYQGLIDTECSAAQTGFSLDVLHKCCQ